ncbi:hypothetical protein FPQ18DRAFT_307337 [Pyronema domesticum]|nr:hypothetical protein FPQ18DRAFT_307337 [Pyronema domesticum]
MSLAYLLRFASFCLGLLGWLSGDTELSLHILDPRMTDGDFMENHQNRIVEAIYDFTAGSACISALADPRRCKLKHRGLNGIAASKANVFRMQDCGLKELKMRSNRRYYHQFGMFVWERCNLRAFLFLYREKAAVDVSG